MLLSIISTLNMFYVGFCKSRQYPLEQLGVEKRSMAGAVLIVPPVVETGDVSVVAKEGLLESSLSRCS